MVKQKGRGVMTPYGQGSFQPQNYQDDLTTDDDVTDPIMDELGDDPTKELGVPADKFAEELDKEYDDEDEPRDNNVDVHDDEREFIEDIDEQDE